MKLRENRHQRKNEFPIFKPISAEEFLQSMFGSLLDFFKNEDELRTIWSEPDTRKKLLLELNEKGFTKNQLEYKALL